MDLPLPDKIQGGNSITEILQLQQQSSSSNNSNSSSSSNSNSNSSSNSSKAEGEVEVDVLEADVLEVDALVVDAVDTGGTLVVDAVDELVAELVLGVVVGGLLFNGHSSFPQEQCQQTQGWQRIYAASISSMKNMFTALEATSPHLRGPLMK